MKPSVYAKEATYCNVSITVPCDCEVDVSAVGRAHVEHPESKKVKIEFI